ncbi:hypothetical protein [Plantactinospora sp. CA-290183]|uniref:hypothetical protein n=1 Tax=Plantactinospora sp. CA-290183 TaxID=3240006 RepID=UPI003D9080C1
MTWFRRTPTTIRYAPLHHRDWRRFWRYCRCGLRWRCPDRIGPGAPALGVPPRPAPVLPRPAAVPVGPPPAPPGGVPARPAVPRDVPPPPAGARQRNRGPAWNAPTGSHLVGRAGRLTPAQAHRTGTGPR